MITHQRPAGLVSILGGKLTTFREVGEEVTDAAYALLGRPTPAAVTRQHTLPGATPATGHPPAGWSAAVVSRLRGAYGTRWTAVTALAERDPGLAQVVPGTVAVTGAEVIYAVEVLGARTVEDVIARRIMTGLDDDLGICSLDGVGDILIRCCGWAPDRVDEGKQAYRDYIQRFLEHEVTR